jgi:hypothetical protein
MPNTVENRKFPATSALLNAGAQDVRFMFQIAARAEEIQAKIAQGAGRSA